MASKRTHDHTKSDRLNFVPTTPRSTKRQSHTPGNNFRSRGNRPQGESRAVSVISFAGPTRPVATKRDMQQVFFDKEQVRLYRKIKEVTPAINTFNDHEDRIPDPRARKLKQLQSQLERKVDIEKENRRLLEKIANIITRDHASTPKRSSPGLHFS